MPDDPILLHTMIGALILVVSAVIGKLLKWLTEWLFKKFASRTETTLDDRILRVVEAKVIPLSIIGGAGLGIAEVRKGLTSANVTHHQILDHLSTVLFVLLILVLFHLLSRLLRTMIEWYAEGVSISTHRNITATVVPFTTKFVNLLLFLMMAMIILDHLGVNIGGLLVSLGVGSLALALAAQETIANMIAWLVILVDQPVRVGDRIRLASGEEGEVFQIGLRSTRILNPDNNLVVVPNAELTKTRIINLSMPDQRTTVIVDLLAAIGTDVATARTVALGLAKSRSDLLASPEPGFFVTGVPDGLLQLRLVAHTPDISMKFKIETELREQLVPALRQAGVELPRLQRIIVPSDGSQTPQTK